MFSKENFVKEMYLRQELLNFIRNLLILQRCIKIKM